MSILSYDYYALNFSDRVKVAEQSFAGGQR